MKTRAELFVLAAQDSEKSASFSYPRYSCSVIVAMDCIYNRWEGLPFDNPHVIAYTKLFAPFPNSSPGGFWASKENLPSDLEPWGDDDRIVALCFAAAMAEAGDL